MQNRCFGFDETLSSLLSQLSTLYTETAVRNLPSWDPGEKLTRPAFLYVLTIASTRSEGRKGACSLEEDKTQHCSFGAQT